MNPVLTIVGSSTRAAAASAARSGFFVHAGDLFADADLKLFAEATRAVDYPAGLTKVIQGPQTGNWMYTGALENSPDLIESWANSRTLLGNRGRTLVSVRDPRQLGAVFGRHGVLFPPTRFDSRHVPADGSWLSKALRSAGGIGVKPWFGHSHVSTTGRYFQQRIDGVSCGATFLANGERAVLLGVTEQILGSPWVSRCGFRYCGSVGPLRLTAQVQADVHRVGQTLASEFELQGLFGVDMVINSHGVWPVEVNPRYTASVEILEPFLPKPAVALHVEACRATRLPESMPDPADSVAGKLIVFADRRLRISVDWLADADWQGDSPWPLVADIPKVGTVVEPGWPIATVFANGIDRATVLRLLRTRASALYDSCRRMISVGD